MNKKEFLDEVRGRLSGLPEADIDKALEFYEESIQDRIDDGLTEDQAVAGVGTPEEVAEQILMDTPLSKIVKANIKTSERKSVRVWEIILIVLGFPIWFSLLMACFAIVLAIAIIFVALIIVFFAVVLAFGVAGIAGLFAGIFALVTGKGMAALLAIGVSLILIGLALLLFLPAKALSIWLIELMGKFVKWIKSLFVKRKNK